MYTPAFYQLKSAYEIERGTEFSDERFAALLYSMPAILIANADGKVDDEELSFIQHIPSEQLSAFRNTSYQQYSGTDYTDGYYGEVRYLVNHVLRWQNAYLQVLRAELQKRVNDKNTIYDMMWRTASTSEKVSDGEIRRLKKLTKVLGF